MCSRDGVENSFNAYSILALGDFHDMVFLIWFSFISRNDLILMALRVGLCGCLVDALPLSTPLSSKPRGSGHSIMAVSILSFEWVFLLSGI